MLFSKMQESMINSPKFNADPSLIALLKDLNEKYNYINYPTYRCAVKFNELKRIFGTKNIPYHVAIGVFQQHRLNYSDNSSVIGPDRLVSVVHDLLFAAEKLGQYKEETDIDIGAAAECLTNFILHVFNSHPEHHISPIELKQIFLLLCHNVSIDDVIREHFLLSSDHNLSVTRYRFEMMMMTMSKIFSSIDTSQHFQQSVVLDTISECFWQCPGIGGLNEYQFNNLWSMESKYFAYFVNVFMTMKRLEMSENILHQSQCVSCMKSPIEGLRFRCYQCRKISLCFYCFCNGFSNRKHEPNHQMYEISSVERVQNKFQSFLAKLCNIFTRQTTDNTAVTVETELSYLDENVDNKCNNETSVASKFGTIRSVANRSGSSNIENLATIIELISLENEKLFNYLKEIKCQGVASDEAICSKQFLDKHQTGLNDAITQLCDVWRNMSSTLPHSSTPYRRSIKSQIDFGANHLSKSIKGIDVNKSYLENNRSDLSVGDVSSWLHVKRQYTTGRDKQEVLPTVTEHTSFNADMRNFKELLCTVKEIIEDSYSDNSKLSGATKQLETVLDDIIGEEERKRSLEFGK